MDDNTVVSWALSPSTSSSVPIVRLTREWRGRSPGTGQKHQLISRDGQWQGLNVRVINIAAGEDIKREILLFAQRHHTTVVLSCHGTISAVNVATRGFRGTITLEGHFSVLSLVGSYRQNHDSPHVVDGDIDVTLATTNGRVIGGRVEDFMVAMDPVQVKIPIRKRVKQTRRNYQKKAQLNYLENGITESYADTLEP